MHAINWGGALILAVKVLTIGAAAVLIFGAPLVTVYAWLVGMI